MFCFFEPNSGFEYLTEIGDARIIPTTETVTNETFSTPLVTLSSSNDDNSVSPSESRPHTAMSEPAAADVVSVSSHDTKKSKGSKTGKKKVPQHVEPPEEEFKVVLKLPKFPVSSNESIVATATATEEGTGDMLSLIHI